MDPPAGADDDPAAFYTGLVAELYAPLRGSTPDPAIYERFIRATGEPALELGCGNGHPLLALRALGLEVEGLDSSPDMLERAQAEAARVGVTVVLHRGDMRDFDTGRSYRSIYLAGATFNLLPTDAGALAALTRIRDHLSPGGRAPRAAVRSAVGGTGHDRLRHGGDPGRRCPHQLHHRRRSTR